MSVAHLDILITRRGGSAADDIRVRIDPSFGDFKLTYTDKKVNFTHFFYAPAYEVVRYVEDLFYLLPNDSDPFDKIQFNFPAFPEFILPVAGFNTDVVRKTVRDRLWSTLENWPENYQVGFLQRARLGSDPWSGHY